MEELLYVAPVMHSQENSGLLFSFAVLLFPSRRRTKYHQKQHKTITSSVYKSMYLMETRIFF